ncbi:MAG: hypothetical protein QGG40_16160, partial [Myxococcota bacterium]|nr:hypothetical protein [Myxococcota bacterium]
MRWFFLALGVTALVYGRAVAFGFVIDDTVLLEGSQRLARPGLLGQALVHDLFWLADGEIRPSPYWRPVVTLSYYFDQWIGGGSPASFHATNLLLLAILAWVAGRTFTDPASRLLVMAVVLLHPLQTEVAVHVSARTDLFAALFGTLAVCSRSPWAIGWTLLALGSKEIAVVIPLLLWVVHRAQRRQTRTWQWHALIVLIWVGLREILVRSWNVAAEDQALPNLGSLWESSSRIWMYLGRLVVPIDSTVARSMPDITVVDGWIAWIGLVGLGWMLHRYAVWEPVEGASFDRSRALILVNRIPRIDGLGMFWILLPLIPVTVLTSDIRYGEGLMCWSVVGLARMLAALGLLRRVAWLAVLVGVWVSNSRVDDWSAEERLWRAAVTVHPNDPLAQIGLGKVILETNPTEAAELFGDAAEGMDPGRVRREAQAGRAASLLKLGREDEALDPLTEAAVIEDLESGWALRTLCVLKTTRTTDRQSAETLEPICDAALVHYPHDGELWNSAGVVAVRIGQLDTARRRFLKAVELVP